MSRRKDLKGQTFGYLEVLYDFDKFINGHKIHYCHCKCSNCGKEKDIYSSSLTTGSTKSCGCYNIEHNRELHTKHGISRHPLSGLWRDIKKRCFNPNCKAYKNYGGRGVVMCDRWKDSLETFYNDLIDSYNEHIEKYDKLNTTIDRIDVNGNYEPNNVRWATRKEQNNNRRNNHFITYNGETHTIAEWSDITGIEGRKISGRLSRNWDIAKALTLKENASERIITHNGEMHNLAGWDRLLGFPRETIAGRLANGWSEERALTTPVRGNK